MATSDDRASAAAATGDRGEIQGEDRAVSDDLPHPEAAASDAAAAPPGPILVERALSPTADEVEDLSLIHI